MNKKWLALSIGSLVIGVLAFVAGYLLWFSPTAFIQNILAEIFGLGIAFGLAILLIEGRILTQHTRRRRIVTKVAKSTLELASEIGMMITWEFGTWLVSALDSSVDLSGEQRGNDWDKDVKPLLRLVYDEAEKVTSDAIRHVDALTYEDYRSRIDSVKQFTGRIRERMDANLEVHEILLELGEKFDELDKCLTQSMWVTSIRSEIERFHSFGRIGNTIINVMETVGQLHRRL